MAVQNQTRRNRGDSRLCAAERCPSAPAGAALMGRRRPAGSRAPGLLALPRRHSVATRVLSSTTREAMSMFRKKPHFGLEPLHLA
jgi:hypothetical protein